MPDISNDWIHALRRLHSCEGRSLFRFLLFGNRDALRIATHMTREELLLLYRIGIGLRRSCRMVEIGSYVGASSCFLAAAASERNGKLVCVDTWQNDCMTEGRRNTWDEFRVNTHPYRNCIEAIRAKSIEAAETIDGYFDLIFVDGDHSYDGVMSDLSSWLPKLNDGGWLILHDWGWAEGVKQAVDEIVRPNELGKATTLPNLYATRIISGAFKRLDRV